MKVSSNKNEIEKQIKNSFKNFRYSKRETAVILAAGHGKRIKSTTSKMLHKIWEKPTVERVFEACRDGFGNPNIIVVVGIKAADVMAVVNNQNKPVFAHQEIQNGTGHAVQVALKGIKSNKYNGTVYILPGDMGLIDKKTLANFKAEFKKSKCDMMVLTGLYDGPASANNYGRIIRVKSKDVKGNPAGKDEGKVIEILEHKDILNLDTAKPYTVKFNGRKYSYSKKELIENNEFNSGVFAFKYKHLAKYIRKIKSENVQNEIYITDLIAIFNQHELSVGAYHPDEQHVLMGFNNKSVLRKMESIARSKTYDRLKDIIEIEDPEDFFIHEKVLNRILKMDKKGKPLDIKISKGVYLGEGVVPNYKLRIKRHAYINGNIEFGKNVTIWENAHLATFPEQKFKIGDNVEILWGDIVKGNIEIGANSRIESSVNMTGSDEFPLRIGKNVTIKGTSYLFGTIVENDVFIEHSVLIKKRVERVPKKRGKVQGVKFYLPMPEGIDSVTDL